MKRIKTFILKNVWILSFFSVFAVGLFLMWLLPGPMRNLTNEDWISYFESSGTIGAFLYLILEKITSEKESKHLQWQSQMPFVTITSPCDPTQNFCNINILTTGDDEEGRGLRYFSVCNHGRVNAFDISISFSISPDFEVPFHEHYISYLSPLGGLLTTGAYEFQDFIYSKYSINPISKNVDNTDFEICGCLDNCSISPTNSDEKVFFVKIEYYSSFSKNYRYKIASKFKVLVKCNKFSENATNKEVMIKSIQILDYSHEDI